MFIFDIILPIHLHHHPRTTKPTLSSIEYWQAFLNGMDIFFSAQTFYSGNFKSIAIQNWCNALKTKITFDLMYILQGVWNFTNWIDTDDFTWSRDQIWDLGSDNTCSTSSLVATDLGTFQVCYIPDISCQTQTWGNIWWVHWNHTWTNVTNGYQRKETTHSFDLLH